MMHRVRLYRVTIMLLVSVLTSVFVWSSIIQRQQLAQLQALKDQLAAEKKARRDTQKVAISTPERLEVTVSTSADGTSWASVAGVPEDKVRLIRSRLSENGIAFGGDCNLGSCGVTVQVRDFRQAARLIQQIRPQLIEGVPANKVEFKVWVWRDKLR